ncbi:MAG: hypothetical protein MI923_27505 [Phycisphaerales bacterium]|nr:hypothetical protein [Phycisphaerales bacterium]
MCAYPCRLWPRFPGRTHGDAIEKLIERFRLIGIVAPDRHLIRADQTRVH